MATSKIFGLGAIAVLVSVAFICATLLLSPAPRAEAQTTQLASAEAIHSRPTEAASGRIRVVDGDTIEDTRSNVTYRLVNIDTPETGSRARCTAERDMGDRAKDAVRTLLSHARRIELRPTGRVDRYGRTIAFVLIDDRDMGETLMAEGLARPWRGRREPWCDPDGNLIP